MDISNLVDGPHERYDGGPANPDVGSMTASHPEPCYQRPYACRIMYFNCCIPSITMPHSRGHASLRCTSLNRKFAGASTIHSDTLGSRRQSP